MRARQISGREGMLLERDEVQLRTSLRIILPGEPSRQEVRSEAESGLEKALEAARDVLLERMKKRAAEQGRADDTPEAIAERLETYEKETAPLLDIYEARGLLVVVNGVGDIDEISGRIISHLE